MMQKNYINKKIITLHWRLSEDLGVSLIDPRAKLEFRVVSFPDPIPLHCIVLTESSRVPHDLLMCKEDLVGACNGSCSPSNYNRDSIIDMCSDLTVRSYYTHYASLAVLVYLTKRALERTRNCIGYGTRLHNILQHGTKYSTIQLISDT